MKFPSMTTRIKRIVSISAIGLVAALSLTACASSAQPGTQGVVVDDYAIWPTAPEIIGCIAPETTSQEVVNNVYYYPSRQISWDATGGIDSERGPYVVVSNSSSQAQLKVPVVVTMDLTTDCAMLKEFHRRLGTKYNAWIRSDNAPDSDHPSMDGWKALLNYVVGQPLELTLTRLAQQYPWQQIWNDESVRVKFEQELQKEIGPNVTARTDGNSYFSNFRVSVLKPDPVNEDLKNALDTQQASVAKADSARQAADAQVAQAKAETLLADENAKKQRAAISGYPTIDDFLKAQVIEKGGNPYQPTYVVPQGGTK